MREPIRHEVKSWPQLFAPIKDGSRPFDVRLNDRGFEVGDRLLLREWEPTKKIFTGNQCGRTIISIAHAQDFPAALTEPAAGALRPGWVILGLKEDPP